VNKNIEKNKRTMFIVLSSYSKLLHLSAANWRLSSSADHIPHQMISTLVTGILYC